MPIVKPDQSILFREMVGVDCEKRVEQTATSSGQRSVPFWKR